MLTTSHSRSGVSQANADSGGGPPPRFYRPELDWLRFLAFLAVFVAHSFPLVPDAYTAIGFPARLADFVLPFVRAGGYGVDLFFALSSFLITELLIIEKKHTGTVHVTSFYVRRALRIWPLYFAFVLTAGSYSFFYREITGTHFVTLLTFTFNWCRIFEVSLPHPLGHLWSVCVEEQFYLIWPIAVSKLKPGRFIPFMVFLFGFACVYRVYFLHYISATPYTWTYTFTRLDGFAFGGILAYLLHGRGALTHSRFIRAAACAIAVCAYWNLGNGPVDDHVNASPNSTFPLAAFASAMLITAFVAGPVKTSLSSMQRALSYLGKISYGLYIFHWPAIRISRALFEEDSTSSPWLWVYRAAFAIVLTLIVSMLSYAFLEKPFLVLKKKFSYVESRPV